jgi:DNA modification methylase
MIVDDLASLATPLDELRPLPGNPRRGDVEAIARSLAAFGQRKPIVANRTTGEVIAGNHTLLAARSLSWPEVAVVWVADDQATAHAYALADNRTAELGGYDDEALAALIEEVRDADAELFAATGWADDDLQALLDQLGAEPVDLATDPDDVPDRAPAITQPGDVWVLGAHRLVCGDARSTDDVTRALDGAPADMVWTDPPYGVDYVGKTADALTLQNDTSEGLADFLHAAFTVARRACRPGAPWWVSGPPGPLTLVYAQALDRLDLYRQQIIWVKDVFVLGHGDYHYRHEPLFYGWVPGAAHQAPADRTHDTVWEIPRPKRSEDHPTMKPVALVRRAIDNHTRRGALVLDPFAGSGTTAIAAELTGRRAALVELDPAYCDVIAKRVEQATGVVPVLEATGEPRSFLDATEPRP